MLLDIVMAGAAGAMVLEVGGAEEAVTDLTKGAQVRGFPSDLVRADLPSHSDRGDRAFEQLFLLRPPARPDLAVADKERRMPVAWEVTGAGRELWRCVEWFLVPCRLG